MVLMPGEAGEGGEGGKLHIWASSRIVAALVLTWRAMHLHSTAARWMSAWGGIVFVHTAPH